MTDIPGDEALPPVDDMVRQRLQDHDTIVRRARQAAKLAERHNDQASLDLLADRMAGHEKQAWRLRGLLEDRGEPA